MYNYCIIIVCISSTNWLQSLFNKLTYLLTMKVNAGFKKLMMMISKNLNKF